MENLELGIQAGNTEMMELILKKIMIPIIVTENILVLLIKENGFLIPLKFLKLVPIKLLLELLRSKLEVNFIYP